MVESYEHMMGEVTPAHLGGTQMAGDVINFSDSIDKVIKNAQKPKPPVPRFDNVTPLKPGK